MTGQRRRDLAFDLDRGRIAERFVTGAKMPRDEAERWMALWAVHAERAGLRHDSPAYWNVCRRWIAGQRESVVVDAEVA